MPIKNGGDGIIMAILGFILSCLILLYFTFVCVFLPYLSQLGGGMRGGFLLFWIAFCIFIGFLWWILLNNAPFTITIGG